MRAAPDTAPASPLPGVLAAVAGLPARPAGGGPAPLVADLRHLQGAGLDALPLPGGGATLGRWRALAAVAAHDVALVKIVEGHVDALAILAELSASDLHASGRTWGTWAAEPPTGGVCAEPAGSGDDRDVLLTGRKQWCSAATALDGALLTCRDTAGQRRLAAVTLDGPGVRVEPGAWAAVGMGDTGSVDVALERAPARIVGGPGAYLARPGFWYGGAGIAACWWGGAAGVAGALAGRRRDDPHAAAHTGAVHAALAASGALLRETAARLDARPGPAHARTLALRARAAVESTAAEVLERTGRALGAAPLCLDAAHARRAADLPVFLRQSHAERDLVALADSWLPESGLPDLGDPLAALAQR